MKIVNPSIKKTVAICLFFMATLSANAANPYLPLWEYIPDGEPYVFEDPDNPGKYRVYIYGSHDSMITEYCGREQVVWSAPVEDLSQWRYDGVIFQSIYDANGELLNTGGVPDILYAPDVAMTVDKNGKKTYYLYPNNQAGGRNGMIAKSDRPDGPFKVCNWDKKNPKLSDGVLQFDPAVFVDDDGRVYGYWGFETSYAAEFDPSTMATVKSGKKIIKDMVSGRYDDGEFRFFEASSMRKIQDKYVFIYSRWTKDGEFGLGDTNYTLAYAYSDNPLGPFKYGGTIIDGRGRETAPDGKTIYTATPSGNTHGSICEINGKWYVFYHRQTGLNEFSRQAMVAPIEVSVEKGKGGKVTITEGEYTSEGFETNGLNLLKTYPTGIACYYTGPTPAIHKWPQTTYYGPYVHPTYYKGNPAKAPSDLELHSCPIVNCTDGSVLGYKYFNFDTSEGMEKLQFTAELMPRGIDATVTIMAGKPTEELGGKKLGVFYITKGDPFVVQEKHAVLEGIKDIKGKQPLFFVFQSDNKGVSVCDLYSFGFAK